VAGFKGEVMQHALAETMDGEYGGPVEIDEGILDALQGTPGLQAFSNQRPDQQIRIRRRIPRQTGFGSQQPASDSALELFCGGFGVGHHQNTLDARCLFHNQAQKQSGDRIRFTCAGAGLDQMDPVKRGIFQIEWLHHCRFMR
jgi:hypothetical protein